MIVTRLYTGIKTFSLHSYRYITNKAACASSKHDDQDDKLNEHIGIHQFFTRQNFPNPDLSIFSTVKILCHTIYSINKANSYGL